MPIIPPNDGDGSNDNYNKGNKNIETDIIKGLYGILVKHATDLRTISSLLLKHNIMGLDDMAM